MNIRKLKGIFIPRAALSKNQIAQLEDIYQQSYKDKKSELYKNIRKVNEAHGSELVLKGLADMLLIGLMAKIIYQSTPSLETINSIRWLGEYLMAPYISLENDYGNIFPYFITAAVTVMDVYYKGIGEETKSSMFPELSQDM